MKTKTINIYSFNELSEKAKQKAIENLIDINVNYDWWEFTCENAANIGLKITSFDLDRNRHATGELRLSFSEVIANILKEHGETCDTYKTAEKYMKQWEPVFSKYMETEEGEEELMEIEAEFIKELLEDYSIILQKEYEYLCSEEAIIEAIEANEYEFTENGKIA
jgi:hypothetical protein